MKHLGENQEVYFHHHHYNLKTAVFGTFNATCREIHISIDQDSMFLRDI